MVKLLYLLCLLSLCSCSFTNTNSTVTLKDSLNATISSDKTIITYIEGLNSLKESLQKIEGPLYTQSNYTFYYSCYKKDSLAVIYEEFIISDNTEFINKTYYLENGEVVLYHEKSKQSVIGDNPSTEFKESRVFYRNSIFLKADERIAESDTLLNSTPFTKVEEILIDKNKYYDFGKIENAILCKGEYALSFDKIVQNKTKKLLVLNNSLGMESSYLISSPDSLIFKIEQSPGLYKGTKLNINYKKQGNNMIYKGEN